MGKVVGLSAAQIFLPEVISSDGVNGAVDLGSTAGASGKNVPKMEVADKSDKIPR